MAYSFERLPAGKTKMSAGQNSKLTETNAPSAAGV
jgi:hypothetical protein